MNNIKIELTMKQFQSLKVVLQYVMDTEIDDYEEYDPVYDGGFIKDHVYAHALNVVEALA